MIPFLRCILTLAATAPLALAAAESAPPLKALYVTGGCCHDYNRQKVIIPEGVSARANVVWTVVQDESKGTTSTKTLYAKTDWARGYDVVVHNECFADDKDLDWLETVLRPHRDGLPAVLVHCAMHCYRAPTNEWFQFCGVTSRRHGPQHPLEVKPLQPAHPVMKGFPELWTTGNEELYAIETVWPGATALAEAPDKKKDAATGAWVNTPKQNAVIWVNTYGKGRVFGTTIAHNNKTMEDPVYLDYLTRGLLWACDKLDANGKPKPGYEAIRAK
jgi:type 1 glutamine amidotransferase